ncbi:MAG: hypothetical protein ABSB78_01995 [Bacteroidota bacterium]
MSDKQKSPLELVTGHPYFLYILVVVTILSFILPLLTAINTGDTISILLILIVDVLSLALIPFLRKYYLPKDRPISREHFKPFESLNSAAAWPRKNESDRLTIVIKATKRKPIILVGESGVGKSVLINSIVAQRLRNEHWQTLLINKYSDFESDLRTQLTNLFPKWQLHEDGNLTINNSSHPYLLLIFDQFEQFLSTGSKNLPTHQNSKDWLWRFVTSLLQDEKNRIIIVVRKELYFDLEFLKEFILSPIKCFRLSGMTLKDPDDGISALRTKLRDASSNQDIVDPVIEMLADNNLVLPVEAQIVGCTLENNAAQLGAITPERLKEMGDKDDLIREFLKTSLASKPRLKDTSLQILFALSMETTYRKILSAPEIANIIHKPKDEVQQCIEWLKELHLVQSFVGNFQLTHDYLAERFHELSGSELEPHDRDNIIFFGDEFRKGHHSSHIRQMHTRPKLFKIASDYFMCFLIVGMLFRLVSPAFGLDWSWFNPYASYQKPTSWFDRYYLPILISHMFWSVYVTLSFRRFFYFLHEGIVGRFLSYLTLVLCLLSVVLAMFIPYCWILSIGLGGLGIGLKQFQTSRSKGLRLVSKRFFRGIGLATLANALGTAVVGVLFALRFHNQTPTPKLNDEFFEYSVYILIGMLYFFGNVGSRHITRKGTSKLLGMFDRRARMRTANTGTSIQQGNSI